MTFTTSQLRHLRAPIRPEVVKQREVEGKVLHYLEGWHIISEANRIFGFDGWDRETLQSQCVWQKQIDYRYAAAYLTRVKITVRAGEQVIQREGLGSGEALAGTAGQAHERASKAAETDATKRALSTFGNSFGLSLYRDKSEAPQPKKARGVFNKMSTATKAGDVEEAEINAPHTEDKQAAAGSPTAAMIETTIPIWTPAALKLSSPQKIELKPEALYPELTGEKIEKHTLPIGEPKRIRNRDHLRYVASQPCLVCGRSPSQAHHLRFAQPRAMGRKVSDEFTVPLCAAHHHELHMRGNELEWWKDKQIEPLSTAEELWTKR